MPESIESRVAYLEQMLDAQFQLNTMMFKLICTNNPSLGSDIAEVLRQMLTHPDTHLSPTLSALVRGLRTTLVSEPTEEMNAAALKPAIRPVD
jgi:hypothetical protein